MVNLGIIANILNAVALLPQYVHTYRSQSVGDMSYTWLLLSLVSNALWIVYAMFQKGGTEVLYMGINFTLFYGYLVFIKVKSDRKMKKLQ